MPSGETQTVSQSKPYGPLQPLLNTAIKGGLKAFRKGYGANTGSMVEPQSKQSNQAYGNLEGIANANSGDQGTSAQYQDIINQGGYNDAMKSALDQYQKTATTEWNPNANPGFQGMLDTALRKTSNSVDSNASAAGRYGSGMHEGVRTRELGDIANQMYSNDYYSNLQRRDAANAALGNLGQAGMNNLATAYQGLQDPSKTLLGVGAAKEDLYRRQLEDKARVNNLPWEQLSKLLAVGSGTGSYNTTTTTAPGPNPFLQTIGMGATGANLLFGNQAMNNGLLGLF